MRLSDLVYLNKSDRQVLLTVLVVAVVIIGVIWLTGRQSAASDEDTRVADTAAPRARRGGPLPAPKRYYVEGRRVERFAFDPNTADSTQLLRLGLQPWQVRNIYKYRAAGGIYREKADFANLYGLTVKQYRELEPYIQISPDYQPASTLHLPRKYDQADGQTAVQRRAAQSLSDSLGTPRYAYSPKIKAGETVDLNALDTAVYKTVPGIGSYYARRLLDYGRRLGGFVSAEQLREIDDFPMESAVYFTVQSPVATRLRINSLSLNDLKRHPYINYYQARAITDYRRQQGRITDLHELSLLPEFSEEAIARLLPYVSYD